MQGEPLRRTITVTNPQGLHLRPLQAFVQATKKFQAEIWVHKASQGQRQSGRSMSQLMLLEANPGDQVVVEVQGPDAAEALELLCEILLTIPADDG